METIKKSFKKNDLYYKLVERTEKTVLFETSVFGGNISGYEVCRIQIAPAGIIFNKEYFERELLPSNEEFGFDGSKAFLKKDLAEAKLYLIELNEFIKTNCEAVEGDDNLPPGALTYVQAKQVTT